jgi:hypothetical protein
VIARTTGRRSTLAPPSSTTAGSHIESLPSIDAGDSLSPPRALPAIRGHRHTPHPPDRFSCFWQA